MAERGYEASQNALGLQAPNRRHNLRTYFEPTGIRVHDRTAEGNSQLLNLSLVAAGRSESLRLVGSGEVTSDGTRVEVRRDHLIEWYENSGNWGWSRDSRWSGLLRAKRSELVLELRDRARTSNSARRSGCLEDFTRTATDHDKLVVVDERRAAGGEARSADRGTRLVVADAGATYPIEIDPLLSGIEDTRLESDQAAAIRDRVAGAGDLNGDGYDDVIVGANEYDAGQNNEGAAFVFLGSQSGLLDGRWKCGGADRVEPSGGPAGRERRRSRRR
ncbi:MAG: FG-GAP repeat protein [Deltaproteobacteria bacterium]|nr:FG-GAP repeat protein [Deltaproteobacteria bacterium]